MRSRIVFAQVALIVVTALALQLFPGPPGVCATATLNDEGEAEKAEIRAAVEDLYIEGLKTRDFDLIRVACVPETRLMGSRKNGELGVKTLDQWSVRFDPANLPFNKLDYEIVKIDRVGSAAQVRSVSSW